MEFINCKAVRENILGEIRGYSGRDLKLCIIQVVGDFASEVYIRNKVKTAESVGIEAEVIKCDTLIDYETLKDTILSVSRDNSVTGVILQLPLPDHLQKYERELLDCIPPDKDVDGLSSQSVGRLWTGKSGLIPATPGGIVRLLPEDLSGKTVTIVSRSDLIGKPLAKLLLDRNATVIICHSKTSLGKTMEFMRKADIVIVAIGKPQYFNDHFFRDGQIAIDCGVNRNIEGTLCGDIDTDSLKDLDVKVTPVPGGVGILTTAQLMRNVLKAYELKEVFS